MIQNPIDSIFLHYKFLFSFLCKETLDMELDFCELSCDTRCVANFCVLRKLRM